MSELRGHVAVVTGAGRGVGRELAMELAGRGVNLVLVARSTDQLASVAAAIGTAVTVSTVAADLAREADVGTVVEAASSRGADILINNAATIAPIGATESLVPSDVSASVALNLVGPILLAGGLLGGMRAAGWGRIVNLSTGAVDNPGAMIGGGVYVATKAALEIQTVSLAAELEGSGVTANVYRPGMVDTGMQDFIRRQDADPVAKNLSGRFVGVREKGMLISPQAAARGLIQRLAGDDNGKVWNVSDTL